MLKRHDRAEAPTTTFGEARVPSQTGLQITARTGSRLVQIVARGLVEAEGGPVFFASPPTGHWAV